MSEAHAVFGWLLLTIATGGLMALAITKRPLSLFVQLAVAGVLLRVVGGLLRHFVIRGVYGRFGDAHRYYTFGIEYAEDLFAFDFSSFLSNDGPLWGTEFVKRASGIILAIIGPTWRGEFIAFGLLGFVGCLCFVIAYYRSRPDLRRPVLRDYIALMCLWPSMWFWPSSVGKEGLLLFGLGVAVLGYVGRKGRIGWVPFLLGLLLVFCIRPHVATVFLASVMVSEWLGTQRSFTVGRTVQALLAFVVFVVILQQTTATFGFSATDLEGAMEFYEFRSGQTQAGGSEIGAVGGGIAAAAMAYVNILFRPFPFEAHNGMALLSALEMTFLWFLAWRRRKRLMRGLRNWRKDRFLRLGLPMTVLYVLMIGLTFSNLGIIARQRVLILPFLFALVVGRAAPPKTQAKESLPSTVGPQRAREATA